MTFDSMKEETDVNISFSKIWTAYGLCVCVCGPRWRTIGPVPPILPLVYVASCRNPAQPCNTSFSSFPFDLLRTSATRTHDYYHILGRHGPFYLSWLTLFPLLPRQPALFP